MEASMRLLRDWLSLVLLHRLYIARGEFGLGRGAWEWRYFMVSIGWD